MTPPGGVSSTGTNVGLSSGPISPGPGSTPAYNSYVSGLGQNGYNSAVSGLGVNGYNSAVSGVPGTPPTVGSIGADWRSALATPTTIVADWRSALK